jgi:hypothetical protein
VKASILRAALGDAFRAITTIETLSEASCALDEILSREGEHLEAAMGVILQAWPEYELPCEKAKD